MKTTGRIHRGKTVVLKCGCLANNYGCIDRHLEGKKWEEQYCERCESWERIGRDATDYDQYAFYVLGRKATARKTSRSLGDLFRVSNGNKVSAADRNGAADLTLF